MVTEKAKEVLKFLEKSSSGTFLFSGEDYKAKDHVLDYLYKMSVCEEKKACGTCAECLKVAKGVFHNRESLRPEEGLIKVDMVREFQKSLHRVVPNKILFRQAIIYKPEQANQQAQNALLKLLEEAPKKTIIFLIARTEEGILPTVLSRSLRIRFEQPYWESLPQISDLVLDTFNTWWGATSIAKILSLTDQLCVPEEDQRKALRSFQILVWDWISYRNTGEFMLLSNDPAPRLETEALVDLYDRVEEAQAQLAVGVPKKMVFDSLFFCKERIPSRNRGNR